MKITLNGRYLRVDFSLNCFIINTIWQSYHHLFIQILNKKITTTVKLLTCIGLELRANLNAHAHAFLGPLNINVQTRRKRCNFRRVAWHTRVNVWIESKKMRKSIDVGGPAINKYLIRKLKNKIPKHRVIMHPFNSVYIPFLPAVVTPITSLWMYRLAFRAYL